MINQKIIKDWGYEEFVIYLYLCVADADFDVKKGEMDKLLKKIIYTLSSSGNSNESKLNEVFYEFDNHNDNEKVQLINEKAKIHCTNKSISKKIIEDLGNAMKEDHMHKSMELIMFRFIRKTLNRVTAERT